MEELYIGLAAVGATVLLVQTASSFIKKKWFLTGPLLAVVVGLLLGPVSGLMQPEKWENKNSLLLEFTRLTLVFADMAIALRLPVAYPLKKWKSLAILLCIGMPLMWISTGAVIYFSLGISFGLAMLIASSAASTDPVVASTIVTGGVAKKNLPGRIRHIISGESGSNDGAAYPIVLLPILLFTHPVEEALSQWGLKVLLWQIGFTILLGAVIGYVAAKLLKWFEDKGIAKEKDYLAYMVALSLLVIGAARIINTDGILAAFVCGIAFRMVTGKKSEQVEIKIQKAISKFFILPTFILFGLTVPWREWLEWGWRGVAMAAGVLLLRRIPSLFLMSPFIKPLRGKFDTLFVGWFGPLGVSTMFYAILILQRTGKEEAWVLGSLLIFASLLVHGFTATPLTRLYGKYFYKKKRGKEKKVSEKNHGG